MEQSSCENFKAKNFFFIFTEGPIFYLVQPVFLKIEPGTKRR
jgi:hypothetical protein